MSRVRSAVFAYVAVAVWRVWPALPVWQRCWLAVVVPALALLAFADWRAAGREVMRRR